MYVLRDVIKRSIINSIAILTTGKNKEIEEKNLEVLLEKSTQITSCFDAHMFRVEKKIEKKINEKLLLMDYDDDELNEEENTQQQQSTSLANTEPQQQQQQTAPTSPIDTGSSSPDLIYSMMQNDMSQLFLGQIFRLLGSVFNALYMQLLMDSLAGNPDISRQMVANNPMFADNPNLREQMVNALSAMMEKMRNPEVQALMQNQQVLKAITQVQEG
jgi:hypothetical protein